MSALVVPLEDRVGFAHVMRLGFPMLVNMGAFSITQFVNRLFLSWDSKEAIAAAVPASGLVHSLFCVFLGTALYTSSFVAQYSGAREERRIGAILWAGLAVAGVGQLVLGVASFFADDVFSWLGHDPILRSLETDYFRVSCWGVGGVAAGGVLGSFFSGRGETKPVMWVGAAMALLNVALDFALIFGRFGFPRLGVLGAAIASVTCQWLGCLVWVLLVFRREHDARFGLVAGFAESRKVLGRLVRFGFPSGMHFFLDGAAWAGFSLVVARLGVAELAASNIAWQIHSLVLLPIFGIGGATTILVGQFQGAGRVDLGRRAVRTSLALGLGYLLLFALVLGFAGEWVVRPFLGEANDVALVERVQELYPFVVALGLAHTTQMIVVSALKGAGDVRFIMLALAVSSTLGFLLPLDLLVRHGFGLEWLWGWFGASSAIMTLVFALRFRGDAWTKVRLLAAGE